MTFWGLDVSWFLVWGELVQIYSNSLSCIKKRDGEKSWQQVSLPDYETGSARETGTQSMTDNREVSSSAIVLDNDGDFLYLLQSSIIHGSMGNSFGITRMVITSIQTAFIQFWSNGVKA